MAKADATLVNAAFTEAKTGAAADVPNMKSLYDSQATISKGYMDQMSNIIAFYKDEKEKERIALEKQLEPFQKIADETLVKLFSLKEAMPSPIINAFEARIQELQDEFELVNTLGDGDTTENRKARMKLMGELSKISSQTIDLRKTTMVLSDRVANNYLNTDVIQKDIVEYAKAILDFKNIDENKDITVDYGRDGIIFKIDGQEFTMNELNEAFPARDETVDADFLKLTKATANQAIFDASGENTTPDYKKDDQRGFFMGKIKTKKDFQQYLRRLDGTDLPSFKEALLDDVSIPTSILSNMFVDDQGNRIELADVFLTMDYNGDGVITESDGKMKGVDMVSFTANMDALIDILTNTSNKAFDLETSKSLLADYYIGGTRNGANVMGIDEQTYYKNFNASVKSKETKSPNNYNRNTRDEGSMVGGGYMKFKAQDKVLQKVINGDPIAIANQGTFTSNGDGTWTGNDANGTVITTEELVRDYLYMGPRAEDKFPNDFDLTKTVNTSVYQSSTKLYPNGPNGNFVYLDDTLLDGTIQESVAVLNSHFNSTATGIGSIKIEVVNGRYAVSGPTSGNYTFSRSKGDLKLLMRHMSSEEFANDLATPL